MQKSILEFCTTFEFSTAASVKHRSTEYILSTHVGLFTILTTVRSHQTRSLIIYTMQIMLITRFIFL